MKTFTVRAPLPAALEPLRDLALNLRWSWDERAAALFAWVDPTLWERSGHDPVALLASVGRDRLDDLATDDSYLSVLRETVADLRAYVTSPAWEGTGALTSVAYFSPEFGIAEALPQYSGGLGVLAGDHLKASSDLGVPLVGIGLFYRQGYFRQMLDAAGWQDQHYPHLDPHAMALTLQEGLRISIEMGSTEVTAQIWRADVGRVRLYLLDADIDENGPQERLITDRLYGGATEHRLRQEILLGMGGLRALGALGEQAQVLHTNEGHAGFLTLERVRQLITGAGLSFREAVEATRAATIFTTHTPVPAGIDRFPRDLMERYFSRWADECEVTLDELMALGHDPQEAPEDPFNMAVLGLRMSGRANAVSKLHAKVTQQMFGSLWPDLPEEEVPVIPITNGVHGPTWVSPEVTDLFRGSVGLGWASADADDWQRAENIDDGALWGAKRVGRTRLVEMVRNRARHSSGPLLDPDALTIGFARRFAPYKRANLLLSQAERLRAILTADDRPVQMVFAGKAHPADDDGKDLIRQIFEFSRDPALKGRFVLVEDYDIGVARTMYHGSDVWLNTPRRPLEACGTSGEKAALNGALNLSILDGWWDEMYEVSPGGGGRNGWAIDSSEHEGDAAKRDLHEANSLFGLLEHEVVPLFYDRAGPGEAPAGWCEMVRGAWISLGHRVSAARMVRDYVTGLYEPAAALADATSADGFAGAKELSGWLDGVRENWSGVTVREVRIDDSPAGVGEPRDVEVTVDAGALQGSDLSVHAVHGVVGAGDRLTPAGEPVVLDLVDGNAGPGALRYRGSVPPARSGRYGIAVRVVPAHRLQANPLAAGLAVWA